MEAQIYFLMEQLEEMILNEDKNHQVYNLSNEIDHLISSYNF